MVSINLLFVLVATGVLCVSSLPQQKKCQCGLENISQRVINGKEVESGRYPWMTGLSFLMSKNGNTNSYNICGGSLITNQHILTAAHCLKEIFPSNIKATLGIDKWYNLFDNPKSLQVESYVVHPGYNFSDVFHFNDDLAILKLKKPVVFSNILRPVCLPDFADYSADELFLMGLGKQNKGKEKIDATVLHEAVIAQRPAQDCLNVWTGNGNHKFNPATEICAGTDTSSCHGDSGGPISIRKNGRVFQVAITSYAENSCNLNTQHAGNVYMKVNAYLDWIRENTQGAQTCAGGALKTKKNNRRFKKRG